MKLWVVVIIFGKIGAAIGPLPYDINECHKRAKGMVQDYQEKWTTANRKGVTAVLDGKPMKIDDFKAECRYNEQRPKMEKFK